MTRTTISLIAAAALLLPTAAVAGDADIGVEWCNKFPDKASCGDLSRCDDLANRMKNYFENNGWTGRFNYGNDWAWEEDYKDPSKGGTDDRYIDTVDIGLYANHGSANGVYFNAKKDDQFLKYDDAGWGDNYDLEWIIFDACSVLDGDSKWNWCSAFNGAHMILGFDTICHDVGDRTEKFARKALNGSVFGSPWTVRQSWYLAAEKTEGGGTYTATMGASNRGDCTSNDYLHGEGSVASDPSPPDYWWWQRHNCN
jgi:hypothetical protein